MIEEARDFLKSRKKCNLTIVVINILVFLLLSLLGDVSDPYFMADHGVMSLWHLSYQKEYYRLFTSMFIHFSFSHLFSNMLLLIFAGDMLETIVGKVRYLIIYLGGGVIGNLFSWYHDWKVKSPNVSAGASGALFAVMGALIFLAILNRKRLNADFIKRIIIVTFLSLLDGYTETNIDNAAHLGGFIGGLLLCVLLYALSYVMFRIRKSRRVHEQ